jgi:hypothetical protein
MVKSSLKISVPVVLVILPPCRVIFTRLSGMGVESSFAELLTFRKLSSMVDVVCGFVLSLSVMVVAFVWKGIGMSEVPIQDRRKRTGMSSRGCEDFFCLTP